MKYNINNDGETPREQKLENSDSEKVRGFQLNPTKLGDFRMKVEYLSIGIPRPDEGWNPKMLKTSKEDDLKHFKANAKKQGLKLKMTGRDSFEEYWKAKLVRLEDEDA